MRITVIGAGIVGVSTAYELARAGHEVTVIDQRESVAADGSFANAGLLSAGSVSPPAIKGMRRWLMRGLWSDEGALRWRPGTSMDQWRWLRRWWQASAAHHGEDVRAMASLAHLSLERLTDVSEALTLDFERSQGVLMLLRSVESLMPTHRHVEMLRGFGVDVQEISAARAREIEPGLSGRGVLAGGVHLPGDGVGNCRQFAQKLREICEAQHHVRFRFNETVTRLERDGSQWRVHGERTLRHAPGQSRYPSSTLAPDAVLPTRPHNRLSSPAVDDGPTAHHTDGVVLCNGSAGTRLVPSLAHKLPVWPVLGYSLSYRLRVDGIAPRSAVVDISPGVAITRLGERLRVSGGFALARHRRQAWDTATPSEAALAPLVRSLECWFPRAADRRHVQVWQGARPMLPEGPPVIGAGPEPGLWLNLGHGAHGWTLAMGAAVLLTSLIDKEAAGRRARNTLDPTPFSLERLRA